MNKREEKTGSPGTWEATDQFTCVQHPKKPQTDIETCGRCGRKDGCDTLKTAMHRVGSPKPATEAPTESKSEDKNNVPAKRRVDQDLIEGLRRGHASKKGAKMLGMKAASEPAPDTGECVTATTTGATSAGPARAISAATLASLRDRLRQAQHIIDAVLRDLEEGRK